MKCVFVATPFLFAVQYHAHARVAQHQREPWPMVVDGYPEEFRMHNRPAPGEALDDLCALFVPSSLNVREATALLADFNAANPGVVPHRLVRDWATVENPPRHLRLVRTRAQG